MMVEFNSMGARCKMDAVYCWGCLSLGIHPCLEWTVGWFVLYRNTVRYQTSILSHLSVIFRFHLVNPHLLETKIFCLPGNLNLALLRASITFSLCTSLARTDRSTCPMLTRATVPWGLPKAPRIPVWSLSAPAHDNILLILSTWKGCTRTRRWKASLPQFFTKYLLAQIRAASRASEEICSYSSETRWTLSGKSSTRAFLRPRSKIRIFASGTPLQKRDLG